VRNSLITIGELIVGIGVGEGSAKGWATDSVMGLDSVTVMGLDSVTAMDLDSVTVKDLDSVTVKDWAWAWGTAIVKW